MLSMNSSTMLLTRILSQHEKENSKCPSVPFLFGFGYFSVVAKRTPSVVRKQAAFGGCIE
jgi:hypothetical protein